MMKKCFRLEILLRLGEKIEAEKREGNEEKRKEEGGWEIEGGEGAKERSWEKINDAQKPIEENKITASGLRHTG